MIFVTTECCTRYTDVMNMTPTPSATSTDCA